VGVEEKLHVFSNSGLDGGERSHSLVGHFEHRRRYATVRYYVELRVCLETAVTRTPSLIENRNPVSLFVQSMGPVSTLTDQPALL